MVDAVTEASDLRVNQRRRFRSGLREDIARFGGKTFMARLDEVKQQGYGDDFIRLMGVLPWRTARPAFIERYTGVVQMLMNKPAYGREALIESGVIQVNSYL